MQVMGVEGAAEAVVRLVAEAPDHLATEAAWVLAYITGGWVDWYRCTGLRMRPSSSVCACSQPLPVPLALPLGAAAHSCRAPLTPAASHETHLNRMVALGVVPPMLSRLTGAVDQMLQDESSGRALLIPLMRSLGNIAAGGSGAAVEQLLSPDAAPALQALVTCAGVRRAAVADGLC